MSREAITVDIGSNVGTSAVVTPVTVTLDAVVSLGDRELAGGGGGVTDHGQLTGLSDDDHPQYHTNSRGDARYFQIAARLAELDTPQAKADARTALELQIIDCGTF